MLGGVTRSTEEDSAFDRGFPSVGPVIEVMEIAVLWFGAAAFALTVSISGNDRLALGSIPNPGLASDVEDLALRSEDNSCDRGVTRNLAEGVDIDDLLALSFVQPSGQTLQSRDVGVENDMWFLASDGCGCSIVEQLTTCIF